MATITKQELEDAAVDAQAFEDVTNGSETFSGTGLVTTRLGQQVKTLAKVIYDLSQVDVGASAAALINAKLNYRDTYASNTAFLSGTSSGEYGYVNETLTRNNSGTATAVSADEMTRINSALLSAIATLSAADTTLQGNIDAEAAARGAADAAITAKTDYITVTGAINLDAINARVNDLDAATVLRGEWNASLGVFPNAGTAQAGATWIVTTAGTVGGVDFAVNDRVLAITDNASETVYAGNWLKLDYTDQVLSVAGKTGAVTLNKSDVGLANVDNTSDADKPVSTAQQGAIDAEAATRADANAAEATARAEAIAQHRADIAQKVITLELELGADGDANNPRLRKLASGGALYADAEGAELLGINSDGSWRLKLAASVAARLFQQQITETSALAIFSALGLGDELSTETINATKANLSEIALGSGLRLIELDGDAFAVSADGIILAAFARDGSLVAKADEWAVNKLVLGQSGDDRPAIVGTKTGGTIYATEDGMEAVGFDSHKMRMHPADATINRLLGPMGIVSPLADKQLVAIGDSLTNGAGASFEETYWNVIAELQGRPAAQVAKGGMVAGQVSALWGTERILLTVSGGTIPASGSVAVTSNIDILVSGGLHQVAYTARGFIAGIECVLYTDTSGNYTITRMYSGDAVVINETNNLFTLSETGTAFIPGRGAYYDATKLVCLGRNGFRNTDTNRRLILKQICDILRASTARYDNYYVFSVPNSSAEPSGTSGYDDVMSLNQLYQDTFGPRYIDFRSYLINYGIYDSGITPTAQDLVDVGNDVIPESFRYDTVHLNALGYSLWGDYASQFIK